MILRVGPDCQVGDRRLASHRAILAIEAQRVERLMVEGEPDMLLGRFVLVRRLEPSLVRELLGQRRQPLINGNRALPL